MIGRFGFPPQLSQVFFRDGQISANEMIILESFSESILRSDCSEKSVGLIMQTLFSVSQKVNGQRDVGMYIVAALVIIEQSTLRPKF